MNVIIHSTEESAEFMQKLFSTDTTVVNKFSKRPIIGNVGFTSLAPEGSLGVVIKDGDNYTCIASESLDRPLLLNAGDAAVYSSETVFIKVLANGEITIENNNNSITLKANGDIEIGNANLDKLVKKAVLTTLAAHTHPVSGAVAGISTDAGMIALPTAPGNFTQNTEAD